MTESPKPNYDRLGEVFKRTSGLSGEEIAKLPSAFFDEALQYADELRDAAYFDKLTGLHNRDGFKRALEEWGEAQPTGDEEIAIVYMDLNNFKKINDEYGHDFGDQALMHIADILREVLRDIDIIVRLGGDEIGLGCPLRKFFENTSHKKTSHEDVFAALDDKLNGALKKAQLIMEEEGAPVEYMKGLSLAIGVVIVKARDLTNKTLAELLEEPDKKMYKDKAQIKEQHTAKLDGDKVTIAETETK